MWLLIALIQDKQSFYDLLIYLLQVAGSMKRDPGLVEIFIDKKTNTVRNEGEVYTFPLLGDTLARIARLVRTKGTPWPG